MKKIIIMIVTDSCFDFIKIILTVYVVMKNCVTNDGKRTLSSVRSVTSRRRLATLNPLNPELNPICFLLALLGAHHFLHGSRIRVKLLTFRLLMSYTYMEHPFLMFLDHTQRRSTVGRTPLDE